MNWVFLGIMGFFGAFVFGSFVEHSFHKYFLHSTPKSLRKSKYVKGMFEGHVVSHHANYMPDDHYTKDDTNHEEVLTFKWYQGPLIVLFLTSFIYGVISLIKVILGISVNLFMPEVIGASIAFAVYYTAYEALHALMHVPDKWIWLRNTRFMVWLNRHHYQHHIDPRANLNVIFPLADYALGTKKKLPKEQYAYADRIT